MSEAAILTPELAILPTPVAVHLQSGRPDLPLRDHAGALTPTLFSSLAEEQNAALNEQVMADLGYRTHIRITGEDRLRWLNGMVSNTIQSLPEAHGNYNFILNAQGRIQGDAYIYRSADHLLLDTDRSQAVRLLAHLDHFIIMDDVELHPLDETNTGIALVGPKSALTLDLLGLAASTLGSMEFAPRTLSGVPLLLVHAYSVQLPRYELWFPSEHASLLWDALFANGVEPAGIDTLETLRVLEGIPRYGVDIQRRHLPQETSQSRALNFTKGCYLGQEIVERIRSRATVHRSVRQFQLEGALPIVPAELRPAVTSPQPDASAVGLLTSVASLVLGAHAVQLGIGSVRNESLERKSRIEYPGGVAMPLDQPPPLS